MAALAAGAALAQDDHAVVYVVIPPRDAFTGGALEVTLDGAQVALATSATCFRLEPAAGEHVVRVAPQGGGSDANAKLKLKPGSEGFLMVRESVRRDPSASIGYIGTPGGVIPMPQMTQTITSRVVYLEWVEQTQGNPAPVDVRNCRPAGR
jgi:hypothetical protein